MDPLDLQGGREGDINIKEKTKKRKKKVAVVDCEVNLITLLYARSS